MEQIGSPPQLMKFNIKVNVQRKLAQRNNNYNSIYGHSSNFTDFNLVKIIWLGY